MVPEKSRIDSPGGLLRHWRDIRKISQVNLALAADISARHLSFVETGRSRPGRNTILKLGRALQLSFRQQNLLFKVAGFRPFFPEPAFEDPDMAPVWDVISQILNQHEPYPALVVSPQYDILWSNHGFQKMTAAFAGSGALEKFPNFYRLIFADDGMRPYFADWEQFQTSIMTNLFEEVVTTQHEGLWALYEELLENVVEIPEIKGIVAGDALLLPFTLQNNEVCLRLFSTVTIFNSASSVTVQEMRIESIFPADEETREVYLELFDTPNTD